MRDVFWIFHRIIVQCSTGVKNESEVTVKENLGRYTRCSLVTTLCRLKCVMCAAWQRYSKARSTPATMSKQHCRMLERWSPYSKMPPKSLKNRQKWLEYSHCCCLRIASVGYAAAISIRFPCTRSHGAARKRDPVLLQWSLLCFTTDRKTETPTTDAGNYGSVTPTRLSLPRVAPSSWRPPEWMHTERSARSLSRMSPASLSTRNGRIRRTHMHVAAGRLRARR